MSIRLHTLFNSKQRFQWDTRNKVGLKNGIYIVFEEGETYHDMDRIVRVGEGRFPGRLSDHFTGNKDGSNFRKNIGKAILNKEKDPYLEIWSKKGAKLNVAGYDSIHQKNIEFVVSQYMKDHFSFICFPVDTKLEQKRLEEGIIAELNNTSDFAASDTWLGKYSPENEIIDSGLWLKEGLNGIPLSEEEYAKIESLCKRVR